IKRHDRPLFSSGGPFHKYRTDPVSTSCGHWFCRQCITSYWDQSASSGDSCCPQCGERSRTSKTVHLKWNPPQQDLHCALHHR
uniref:RING-type domain-containing protein n=1 Tax=Sander lucioperca TaxID=283035 RepID=A0A8C9XWJ4_SANLU